MEVFLKTKGQTSWKNLSEFVGKINYLNDNALVNSALISTTL